MIVKGVAGLRAALVAGIVFNFLSAAQAQPNQTAGSVSTSPNSGQLGTTTNGVMAAPSDTDAASTTPTNSDGSKAPTPSALPEIHINGFLSAGGSITNSEADYLIPGHGQINNRFDADANSLIGLQFTADLIKNFQAVAQFVADGEDINGSTAYRVDAEWAFLRYSPSDNYQLRLGRFRIPAFLYSETAQVGYSYPWVRLPSEIYRIVPFNNINGINLLYRHPVGDAGWTVSVEPYYGENKHTFTVFNDAFKDGVDIKFTEDNLHGLVVTASSANLTLRGTYLRLKLTAVAPPAPPMSPDPTTIIDSKRTEFWEAGLKWSPARLLVIGEYAVRKTPDQIASLSGYYASVGYHIGKLLPLVTYAHIKTTNTRALARDPEISERPQDQDSYTFDLNYTLSDRIAAKASISRITPLKGTFGLFNKDPGREHVMLYAVSVDVIF